jgi:hypothetical protein
VVSCSYCKSRAVHYAGHFGKFLCGSHLETYLLRKLRRNLNKHHLVSPRDVVAVEDDGSPAAAAAGILFRKAVGGWPVIVVEPGEKHDKLMVPVTLERETTAIIGGLVEGEFHRSGYAEGKQIMPFRDFTTKELFVLGWLEGRRKEGNSDWLVKGAAPQLNLLRSWDRIRELKERPRSAANKAAGARRKR